MNCIRVGELLEDYHYNELDDRAAAEVTSHLQACAGCASAFSSLESESRLYEAFAKTEDDSLNITPKMWQSVRASLSLASADTASERSYPGRKEARPLSFSSFFPVSGLARQAAFAVALVVVSVVGTLVAVRYWQGENSSTQQLEAQINQPASGREGSLSRKPDSRHNALEDALEAIRRAEQEYIEAINVLSAIVERRKSTLDPQLAAELEQNLRAIDQAIDSTRKAYNARPYDPELALYMLTAYARKVELLQEVAS